MNAIDRVIGYFAPQAGMKRVRARHAMRIYEGAAVGRRASSWKALHTSANAEIQLAIRPLRDRSRDLCRNTPHAPRMRDITVAHAVGTGIVPVSATGIDRLDRQVDQLWADWVGQADVTGQLSYYAMQALAVGSTFESGEVVLRFIDRPLDADGLAVPLQLQLLESDYIDQFRDGIYGDRNLGGPGSLKKSRLGVGLGDFDKRLGLWLWPYHPGEITTINMRPLISEFVPADELVHMFRVLRPGQVRGVPWLAPVLTTARELSDFLDAVNVKARVEACFAGFITNDDATAPLLDAETNGVLQTFDQALPNATIATIEPGMLKELRQGQKIDFAQPTSTTQIEPILLYNLQAMAAAVGCTYDMATGDLRQVNYTSLRAGKIDFWKLIAQFQAHTVVPDLCQRPRARWISRAILAGRLRERTRGYPCEWVPPAKEAVDPKKDLEADKSEVRSGRVTPQRFIASKGGTWRNNISDFSTFFKASDKEGLVFDIDPRKTDWHGRAPSSKGAVANDNGNDQADLQDAVDAADTAADAEDGTSSDN